MLKSRIQTAAVLITFVLITLFLLPPFGFIAVLTMVFLYAGWEYSRLIRLTHEMQWGYLVLLMTALIGCQWLPKEWIVGVATLWWIGIGVVMLHHRMLLPTIGSKIYRAIAGLLVLIPFWFGINILHVSNTHRNLLMFLLILIWTADTSAYFIGTKWGKHYLAPAISPKKSMEGLYGAIVMTFLVSMAGCFILRIERGHWLGFILISMISVLFSIVGDLFESLLKRQQGLKESGEVLPGHGGLLDRIDSLTAAAPIFVMGSILLGLI